MPGMTDFIGIWQLSRQIDDRLSGQTGRFDGTAEFAPEGQDRLRHTERGVLRIGAGPALEARREYFWVFDADGVAVTFDDDRPFHRFRPEGAAPGTDHPCGADLYRVNYDFTGWPEWRVQWQVNGPRKNYRMDATYQPVSRGSKG